MGEGQLNLFRRTFRDLRTAERLLDDDVPAWSKLSTGVRGMLCACTHP